MYILFVFIEIIYFVVIFISSHTILTYQHHFLSASWSSLLPLLIESIWKTASSSDNKPLSSSIVTSTYFESVHEKLSVNLQLSSRTKSTTVTLHMVPYVFIDSVATAPVKSADDNNTLSKSAVKRTET